MMAIDGEKMDDNNDEDISDSEVHRSAYELAVELDTLNDTLLIQDHLLKCVVRECNKFNARLEVVTRELEIARDTPVVPDETKVLNHEL